MHVTIITLFPQMFEGVFNHSILKRAQQNGKLSIDFLNLKEFGSGVHKMVDDTPYGGGVGMVLKVDILDQAIDAARKKDLKSRVILLDPKGRVYTHTVAKELSTFEHLILVCGHYEGFDERIRSLVDDEISIGDYVLSGGEIAAMAITESVARLTAGVLVKEDASRDESFSETKGGILEHPQYTRPQEYKGMRVPDVLLSGHAARITEFRDQEAKALTKKRRPDLLK